MDGWVKVHRQLLDSSYWMSETFTRGQAWVDMLLLANIDDGFIRKQGIRIDLQRGDLGWSENELATRWKWSRGKVRRFLDELENDGMIERKNDSKTDKRKFIITICNYKQFQDSKKENGQATDKRRTSDGQATVQEQEEKKKRRKEDSSLSQERFDMFWEKYPRKSGKKDAFKAWEKQKCFNGHFELIMERVDVFRSMCAGKEVQFIPLPATWINGERWNDEVEPEHKGQKVGGYHFE